MATENQPDHLLSFVTNGDGVMVTIHADLAGVTHLISELESMRQLLTANDCPHTHLRSFGLADDTLTTTKLDGQATEENVVTHVKIYGWNQEWSVKHGLRKAQ